MERVKNYLLGSAALIIAALVLTLATDVRRAVADEFKNVRVINTESMPANVRDTGVPIRTPVQIQVNTSINTGEVVGDQLVYTVPAGKRLVIEHVAVFSDELAAGNTVRGFVRTRFGGTNFFHSLDLRVQAPVDGPLFAANHPLLAFADPETFVRVTAIAEDLQVTADYHALFGTLSGYLEEAAP